MSVKQRLSAIILCGVSAAAFGAPAAEAPAYGPELEGLDRKSVV